MREAKKTFVPVAKVRAFLREQPVECQAQFAAIVATLETNGFLVEPFGKKLDDELFEIRVRKGKHVRVFYFYYEADVIVGVHAFVKKSQKTPLRELRQARRVVQQIRRGGYVE